MTNFTEPVPIRQATPNDGQPQSPPTVLCETCPLRRATTPASPPVSRARSLAEVPDWVLEGG